MSLLSRYVQYYGVDRLPDEKAELRAGPLTLNYTNGDLQYVKLGEKEVVRRIYVAARDRNWGTLPNVISDETVEIDEESFRISYAVENRREQIDFSWQASIVGNREGEITFEFDGTAQSTFLTCRIGFCILHPVRTCIGKPCIIADNSENTREGTFPQFIAREGEISPFVDMAAMTYEIIPGMDIKIRFSGDLFEMEDQRNWTDGSYKTFCTPSRLECPREVKKGSRINQSVVISLLKNSSSVAFPVPKPSDEMVRIHVGKRVKGKVPPIGLALASHNQPLSDIEVERFCALHLAHLRLDLKFTYPDCLDRLRMAAIDAKKICVPLEVALYLEEPVKEFPDLTNSLREIKPSIVRWIIFDEHRHTTTADCAVLARQHLGRYGSQIMIGGGSNADFNELNNLGAPYAELDFVCYSINPQVHLKDNDTLVENLEAQADTVVSARQLSGGLPVVVSPVTLKQRFNPVATGPEAEAPQDELPPQVDARQMSLFGAGWTLGSLKYLSESGASSLTYYETAGWCGVMEAQAGSPKPEKFPSLPGCVFPIYHVLGDVNAYNNGNIIEMDTSDPLRVAGFALSKQDSTRLLLVNLTVSIQKVSIHGLGRQIWTRVLDETNVEEAMLDPSSFRGKQGGLYQVGSGQHHLKLLPYALARIDVVPG